MTDPANQPQTQPSSEEATQELNKEQLNASILNLRNHPRKALLKSDAKPLKAVTHSATSRWKHIEAVNGGGLGSVVGKVLRRTKSAPGRLQGNLSMTPEGSPAPMTPINDLNSPGSNKAFRAGVSEIHPSRSPEMSP